MTGEHGTQARSDSRTEMPPVKPFSTPVEVLGNEILQEQASALGRLGRKLEKALADLRVFDESHPGWDGGRRARTGDDDAVSGPAAPPEDRHARQALVSAAGQALWMFVVQRESCGLRDSRHVMRDYKVPPEVQERMGIFPSHKGGSL
jgi:hypothetical protein